ncbi:MAG: hypothetical protein Q9225_004645, partial [Loekoesia sp. 1 TL-2023]
MAHDLGAWTIPSTNIIAPLQANPPGTGLPSTSSNAPEGHDPQDQNQETVTPLFNGNTPLTKAAINSLSTQLISLLSAPSTSPLLLLKQLIEAFASGPAPIVSYQIACYFNTISAKVNNYTIQAVSRLPYAGVGARYWPERLPLNAHRVVTVIVLDIAASEQNVVAIHQAQAK